MSELSDFIAQRKAALTARRDELEAQMVAQIKKADLETLKTVAFALGLDDPPDFSVVPRPTTPPGPDTREGE